MIKQGEIVIYKSEHKNTSIEVRIEDNDAWVTQRDMLKLFNKSKQNISLHISNIFKENELDNNESVVKEYLTTARDGKTYNVKYYNLDMVMSVGYRVKSKEAIRFRKWATKVLKNHILRGVTINQEQIENRDIRIKRLEENRTTPARTLSVLKERPSFYGQALRTT